MERGSKTSKPFRRRGAEMLSLLITPTETFRRYSKPFDCACVFNTKVTNRRTLFNLASTLPARRRTKKGNPFGRRVTEMQPLLRTALKFILRAHIQASRVATLWLAGLRYKSVHANYCSRCISCVPVCAPPMFACCPIFSFFVEFSGDFILYI